MSETKAVSSVEHVASEHVASEHVTSRRAVLRTMGVGAVALGSGAALAQAPAGPAAPPSTVTNPPRDFSPARRADHLLHRPRRPHRRSGLQRVRQPNTAIQRLWTGALWSEGPAWNAQGRYLVWSDIPNNRQLRWLEDDGRGQRLPHAVEQQQRQHASTSRGASSPAST